MSNVTLMLSWKNKRVTLYNNYALVKYKKNLCFPLHMIIFSLYLNHDQKLILNTLKFNHVPHRSYYFHIQMSGIFFIPKINFKVIIAS